MSLSRLYRRAGGSREAPARGLVFELYLLVSSFACVPIPWHVFYPFGTTMVPMHQSNLESHDLHYISGQLFRRERNLQRQSNRQLRSLVTDLRRVVRASRG